jgi:RNA polymerase sigma-70 factor (ECF subfamily)
MDHEHLVRLASGGDVEAFVDLTRRFQQFAFGSALTLVRDFQQAEDVVQEAFLAAWSALPGLADPGAFPGWLRGIVRHHAFRMMRRQRLRTVSLTEAEELPSDEPPADYRLAECQQATAALAAIADLPDKLREPATLYFRARVLASRHRNVSWSACGDSEQPPACGSLEAEGEDADHGDRDTSFARTDR